MAILRCFKELMIVLSAATALAANAAPPAPLPAEIEAYPEYEVEETTERRLTVTPAQAAAIILDYTQQLREKGKELVEALLEAAPIRLRPIVMTNVAIAIALLPQAMGSGAGSFYRIPMAVVTIGGVLVAAVFTLFLIPVIYAKLDRYAFAAHAHQRETEERRASGEYRVVNR